MYTTYGNLNNEFYGVSVGDKSIPLDPSNTDYQKCLDAIIEQGADCFEGNIPTELQEAADVKQASTPDPTSEVETNEPD